MNPLARIAYNMIAEGGEAVGKSAADDVLKAASKIADEGVEVVDDWGWKGGKPGELTGGEFTSKWDKLEEEAEEATRKALGLSKKAYSEAFDSDEAYNLFLKNLSEKQHEMGDIAYEKLRRTANPYILETSGYDAPFVMREFSILEKADFPREWTGKALPAIRAYQGNFADLSANLVQNISNLMRPMTNDQRETFLALLPEWTESLDELAKAAKTV